MTKVSQETIDVLKKFDTTSVSDAMDVLGIPGGLLGIKPVVEGTTFCGPAFTVHYVPCGLEKGTVGDFLDDVEPGQVVVIDNGGRLDCTVWGDLMTISASGRGIAATVIDGVCRDIPGIKACHYPVFSKGSYMVTGKDRVQCDAVNGPVSIAGLQVKPGDIMLGDDTGVLVIPMEKAEAVCEVARNIAEKEQKIEQELRKGSSLREARSKTNYHKLQTRRVNE